MGSAKSTTPVSGEGIHDTGMDSFMSCDSLEKAKEYIDRGSPILLRNYVSGSFSTVDTASTPSIESVDPKTGAVFAQVPCTQYDGVETAIRAAKDAFPAWSKTTRAQRSKYLRRISELLEEHRDVFAVWESIDQGKTLERARIEVDRAISNFSYFSTYILHEQTAARMIDSNDVLTYEHRSPRGVFALISPWNMPLYLLTWKIAPCLAFGCTAVAKPSELTSMTAFLLCAILSKAGLPSGVINIIFGDGATTGAALVTSPLINGVSFTGGTSTGITIRKLTTHQISKHLSLELGGKNPTLVFADALGDEESRQRTIRIAAAAAFENQGEICLCGSRIYVEQSVYDDFKTQFARYVKETYVLGKTVGAVVSKAHYGKISGYLALASEEGAEVLVGNDQKYESERAGYWIEPTVLTGLAETSKVIKDEIFGPVVTISSFATENEAVRLANDNEYGLAAVVLTTDGARMRRVAEHLEAGLVWVNGWLQRELGTPFGGMKGSGTGREGGEYSRDVFTVVRTVHLPSSY